MELFLKAVVNKNCILFSGTSGTQLGAVLSGSPRCICSSLRTMPAVLSTPQTVSGTS